MARRRRTRGPGHPQGAGGRRCTIGYAALGRLGMTYRRRQREALAVWMRVTEAILAELAS